MAHSFFGKMDVPCPDCGALHWTAERLTNSSDTNPCFGMCCFQGKIKLGPLHNIPQKLKTLFRGQNPQANEFQENIQRYNNALAMTSLGCKVDESVNRGNGPMYSKFMVASLIWQAHFYLRRESHLCLLSFTYMIQQMPLTDTCSMKQIKV